MTAALFATYFTVMGAKCALPSTLSLLTSSTSSSNKILTRQSQLSSLLTLSTLAIACGKFLLGPLIDAIGGITSLQIALSILGTLLAIISTCTDFGTFAACWIGIDFIFSATWAACLHAVHQCFGERDWSGKIGMLAVAARTGNAAAFMGFASVLGWSSSLTKKVGGIAAAGATGGEGNWRLVFATSALFQLIPFGLLSYFRRLRPTTTSGDNDLSPTQQESSSSSKTQHKTNDNIQNKQQQKRQTFASLKILRQQLTKPTFYLHLLSRSSLMVYGSFLLFVPTLMTSAYSMSSSMAARVGSIFALGCLVSVSTLSSRYSTWSKQRKMVVLSMLLCMSTLCAVSQWLHVSALSSLSSFTLSPLIGTIIMFCWGLSFSVPFYIPPSLYALEKGGRESSATIADVFDFGGFSLLALFNRYVAQRLEKGEIGGGGGGNLGDQWCGTFGWLIGCALMSWFSLCGAVYLEGRDDDDNDNDNERKGE